MNIPPATGQPLYLRLARYMEELIAAGTWLPGETLPAERSLAEEYGVSRVTVRKSLKVLIERGQIKPRHGAGNFVAGPVLTPHFEQSLTRLIGFSEMLATRGYTSSSIWLERGAISPKEDVLVRLGLPAASKMARLKRQRLADTQIVAVEENLIALDLLPQPDMFDGSLYAYLEAQGSPITRAMQYIGAINADADLAANADVPVGTALLVMTRIGFLASGRAVEHSITWCRTDYYNFVVELTHG